MTNPSCRHLVLVLGDQLDAGAAALRDLDPARDLVWMCEAVEESTHVPSHKARILLFLSAMRHFRDALEAGGIRVHYRALDVEANQAPLASVEGFVRQILGWRGYVRGIYWREGPVYLEANVLEAQRPLPNFYWTGQTDYACLEASIGQVLEHGYGHHIQRLMVTGLFALLLGVAPREVHAWYLAMFADAVERVEAPNVIGMSQFADGELLASKSYVATGQYINRMSNYSATSYHLNRVSTVDADGLETKPD